MADMPALRGRSGMPERRLRHELRRLWSDKMRRALVSLDGLDCGGYRAIFDTGTRQLAVVFPKMYPFAPFRMSVCVMRVEHSVCVAAALSPLCADGRAAVAGMLREAVEVEMKEWLYCCVSRREGVTAAAELMRVCSTDMPPHMWSPAMGLRDFWQTVVDRMERAEPGCASAAR